MFENVREKIKAKLQAVASIQEVHDFPTEEFNGFPAAVVASARNESQFETTIHNKRTYVFTVYIFQENEQVGGDESKRKARRIVEGVVDDVIEAFDRDQLLSGIVLPTNETMIIAYPVLSEIYNDVKYTVGELEIKVVISFDIT